MFAFDVYRSDTWHEPLEFDDEIISKSDEVYYGEFHNPRIEHYESWYHDGRTLTIHMLNEVYDRCEGLKKKNYFDIRVGQLAYIVARFPRLIRELTEDHVKNLESNNHLNTLRGYGCGDEAFAWFLIFDLGRWKWGDDKSNDVILANIKKLHDEGVSFDEALPYIAASVTDADIIIESTRNNVDVALAGSIA